VKRILKWTVPVDDQHHDIGAGRVVHVACQHHPAEVQVWTEETTGSQSTQRALVVGTGLHYPDDGAAVGTVVVSPGLVWHVVVSPTTHVFIPQQR
jgi:hypothetical protein